MTTCASCGRDRPDSDKFCRYCGVEVDKPEATSGPRGVRTGLLIGAAVLLVGAGVWLQTRPTTVRPSEVSGQRQGTANVAEGPPFTSEQEAAFAKAESLLSAETGSLVAIGPEKTEAIVLSGTKPRKRIALPPAIRWEITDNGLVGFIDEVHANVMRFSAPGEFVETKAARLYTDLNGELIHAWQDGDRIRVLPVFDDVDASGGDFSAFTPTVRNPDQPGKSIGLLLTTYQGDTYGWNSDGEWERVAAGSPAVATDPAIITECDDVGERDASCVMSLINLRSGQERAMSSRLETSIQNYGSDEAVVISPDLAFAFSLPDRTLIDMSRDSVVVPSLPSRSWRLGAAWSLDSSILGVDGAGLRLFTTTGEILTDVIPAQGGTVMARFVPDDTFGAGR